MRRILASLCVTALLFPPGAIAQQRPSAAPAQPAPPASATKLPVKRVVLYKNGVGYFEHPGRVRGNQDVTIEFTSGQLNDVLKSLTILDLGGGRVSGVNYNSEAPLEQRLRTLRLPLGAETTVAQFLGALRGVRLQVTSGAATVSGRLLSVERKTKITDRTSTEVDVLSLISDTGEMRTVELSPGVSVRIAERDMNEEVGRYLNLISSTRQQDLRRMTVSTAGTGERPLYVSYISEVPIWKTTYRIVLPTKAGAKPLLQGWAIVDNTVGEDWENVELSLVAGAPQSFIQQLSQPYYSRRPVVPLPESVQLTPQTHQATLLGGSGRLYGQVTDPTGASVAGAAVSIYNDAGGLVAQTTTDAVGEYTFAAVPPGSYRLRVISTGFKMAEIRGLEVGAGEQIEQDAKLQLGEVASTVVVEAGAAVLTTSETRVGSTVGRGVGGGALLPRGAINRAMSGLEAAAQTKELGDLFEYKLKEPVTIRKNQSALVPIVNAEIGAEKVSLWNESLGTSRPLRALWLTNTSNLTLDGGSFNVLEDETFAGEGLVEALKPGEKRLLSYAIDLGVLVDTKRESQRQRVTRVRIARGVMLQTSEEREQKTYTVRNEDTSPRTLVIEHPVRPEWKLTDAPAPAETSTGYYRFRLTVEPKTTATLVVNQSRPIESRFALTSVTDDQIALFARQRSISPEVEAALRRILAQKNVVADLASQIATRQSDITRIFDDQNRVRENMKVLKGSAEEKALLLRYTRQLDEQENRLDALRKEVQELEAKKNQAQAELNKMIQDLTLDVNL